jgi:hypothetical protein
MAVVIVTRFAGHRDFAPLVKEAAALLKKHGAASVRAGRVQAGPDAGHIVVATTVADWPTYGRFMQGITTDPAWRKVYGEFAKNFELRARSVIAAEEF